MDINDKTFFRNVYSVSNDDLMQVWIETFHPFGSVLVIWDAQNHFDVLIESGLVLHNIEAYNNKVVTVDLPDVLSAYELMDKIESFDYNPFMQVYLDGKLLSDNISPNY
tara:strand:- start:1493 stop:1819 length:327 start_codon:yes stop_codon:yes gene_type:complete